MISAQELTKKGAGKLPGHLGIVITDAGETITATLAIEPQHMAPNGYLHAGTVVTLADTAAGYGCIANLPAGATGFTTIELKSNFFGTAREGMLECTARAEHAGRTTQVWAATVVHRDSGKTIALFRCTQLVIYPKG